VLELLANNALRQGMGLAARDRAEHRYSWAHIATETSRVYHRIASQAVTSVTAGGRSLPA
jgi:glycosyltransferase involved in cell wall biosynthesis